jgi:uncharacterized membrane protein
VAGLHLRHSRSSLAVVGVVALGVMLIHAYAGHAGAASSWRWFRVGTQWVHLAAAAVWVGGLAWLLFGIRQRGADDRLGAVQRFSTIAGFALAGVAVTGVLRAWDEVGSVSGLLGTGFGNVVVAKIVLFAAMAGLGAVNRYRVIPSIQRTADSLGVLPRIVGAELLLAAGVFSLTGVMTELSPPATGAAAALANRPSAVSVVGHDFGQQATVRLTASPGTAGPNAFQVRVQDFNTGRSLPARRVTLGFTLPDRPDIAKSQLPLSSTGPGAWSGRGTNLSIAGSWSVEVLIEQATTSIEVPLSLRTRSAPQQIRVIPGGSGQPTIYQITLPGTGSVQAYVDPGGVGANELHFTFFRTSGNELPIATANAAARSAGTRMNLALRRLSRGHFVADVRLSPGRWTFSVNAITKDRAPITATFEEMIK